MAPELELQGAIYARLMADTAVTALIGSRVYDRVSPEAQFPYVTFGPTHSIADDAECITGFEVAQQIDIWSRGVGWPECKTITDAVRAALHSREADMPLTVNALVLFEHRDTDFRRDPDGLTSHGILGFEAVIERR